MHDANGADCFDTITVGTSSAVTVTCVVARSATTLASVCFEGIAMLDFVPAFFAGGKFLCVPMKRVEGRGRKRAGGSGEGSAVGKEKAG